MKKCQVIVCCHKKDVMAIQEPYLPIHVGKSLSSADLEIQADNDGENISEKNQSYCELTGLYWAWKNLKDVDVIGLSHYRRYFDFHNQCVSYLPHTAFHTYDFAKIDLSIPQQIIDSVKDGVAYVAAPRVYNKSLHTNYCEEHISDDIHILEKYIFEKLDIKYATAYFKVMHQNNKLMHYNMFLMTWRDFDAYCSWLFHLLQEMENQIDISHYTPVQRRIFGYMAERLFNVWLEANEFQIYHKPVIWFSDYEASLKNPSRFRMCCRNTKASLAHYLSMHKSISKYARHKHYQF